MTPLRRREVAIMTDFIAAGAQKAALGAFAVLVAPTLIGLYDAFYALGERSGGTDHDADTHPSVLIPDVYADVFQILQFPAEIYAAQNYYETLLDPDWARVNGANLGMLLIIAYATSIIYVLEFYDKSHYDDDPSRSSKTSGTSENQPCSGYQFRDGAAALEAIGHNLTTTKFATGWSGLAVDDLTECVVAQQHCTTLMAQADNLLADTTDAQAHQVTLSRQLIAGARLTLACAIPIAVALYKASPIAALAWQVTCAASAVVEVALAYRKLLDAGLHTADKVQRATATYQQVYESAAAAIGPAENVVVAKASIAPTEAAHAVENRTAVAAT